MKRVLREWSAIRTLARNGLLGNQASENERLSNKSIDLLFVSDNVLYLYLCNSNLVSQEQKPHLYGQPGYKLDLPIALDDVFRRRKGLQCRPKRIFWMAQNPEVEVKVVLKQTVLRGSKQPNVLQRVAIEGQECHL